MIRDQHARVSQGVPTDTARPTSWQGESAPKVSAVGADSSKCYRQPTEAVTASPRKTRSAPPWERLLLRRLLKVVGSPPIVVELYDGTEVCLVESPCPFRVRIRDRHALWKLVLDPMFQFAELYTEGRLDVEGELSEVLTVIFGAMSRGGHQRTMWQRFWQWLSRPVNTIARSRANAAHHYDLGNDFYRLWLDEQMVYTCAYFARPEMSLEEAQVAKMDHVCRKLRLSPGQRVLEMGCGWGALAIHMAQRYGVVVDACNVSREQLAYARQRAQQLGFADQVTFLDQDWRCCRGTYDRVVSVGMLEHVGPANYSVLGKVIRQCLAPDGLALIHTIGRNFAAPVNAWIRRYIFPGGYAPSLKQMMSIFEPYDFSVLDVENIRLHYAQTLGHWSHRFERHVAEIAAKFGERFVRLWRFYLCCSRAAFQTGSLQLFQVLFSHGTNNHIPRTRDDIYVTLDRGYSPAA